MNSLVGLSRSLAESQLAEALPRRWQHVQAVGAKAETVGQAILGEDDRRVLTSAAWLHDVGYAPEVASTGFHPLDGARWLRERGFDERVAALVAHHSCAAIEADERGLADQLSQEFTDEASVVSDALWYVDMTTGPDGQHFDVVDRLDEIRSRYGPDDIVTRFINRARPDIIASVRRTEERLKATEAG